MTTNSTYFNGSVRYPEGEICLKSENIIIAAILADERVDNVT